MFTWSIKNPFYNIIKEITNHYKTQSQVDLDINQDYNDLIIKVSTDKHQVIQTITCTKDNIITVTREDNIIGKGQKIIIDNVDKQLIINDVLKYLQFFGAYQEEVSSRSFKTLFKQANII